MRKVCSEPIEIKREKPFTMHVLAEKNVRKGVFEIIFFNREKADEVK